MHIALSETLIRVGNGFAVEIAASLTVAGDWRGGIILASLDGDPARTVARLTDGATEAVWQAPPAGTITVTVIPGTEAAPAGTPFTIDAIQARWAPGNARRSKTWRGILELRRAAWPGSRERDPRSSREDRGVDRGAGFCVARIRSMSRSERRAMAARDHPALSLRRQCRLAVDRTLLALLPAEGRERSVPIRQAALILSGMCL